MSNPNVARCRVKICGITSVADAQQACLLGVDALGLVFYPNSPRYVSTEMARTICLAVSPFVARVGLFVNASADEVKTIVAQVPLDVLQFHGSEPAEYCRAFNRPYIKALGMLGADFVNLARPYSDAQGLLVDSHAPGAVGGTGVTFDWTQLPHHYPQPLILAGGLTPMNVYQAIKTTAVYAVDVSSGVELAAGIKDPVKVKAFLNEVERVECERKYNEH